MTGTWIDEKAGSVRRDGQRARIPSRTECPSKTSGATSPWFFLARSTRNRAPSRASRNAVISSKTGPSYLVHLYEEDPSFPKSLNGRFQGLVADRTRGVATLFNDRYSMHRLYYHEANDAFYFSVEAKAILAVRPELRRTGSPQPRGVCCVRMRARESDALRGSTCSARRVSLDLPGRLNRDQENIFRAP